jgi:hypothetical protein
MEECYVQRIRQHSLASTICYTRKHPDQARDHKHARRQRRRRQEGKRRGKEKSGRGGRTTRQTEATELATSEKGSAGRKRREEEEDDDDDGRRRRQLESLSNQCYRLLSFDRSSTGARCLQPQWLQSLRLIVG